MLVVIYRDCSAGAGCDTNDISAADSGAGAFVSAVPIAARYPAEAAEKLEARSRWQDPLRYPAEAADKVEAHSRWQHSTSSPSGRRPLSSGSIRPPHQTGPISHC